MIYKPVMLAGSLAAAAIQKHAVDGAYYQLVQSSRASQYGRNLYTVEKVLDPSENMLHDNHFPYDFELPPTLKYQNSNDHSQVKNPRRQRMKYSNNPRFDHYHQKGVRKMGEQNYQQDVNKIGEADMYDNNTIEDQLQVESISNVEQIKNPLARIDIQKITNMIPSLTKQFNIRNPSNNIRRQQSLLTPMNVGFIMVLLVLMGKVFLSVLLAGGFVIAGQALYAFAQATGTTSVFGMDSTLTFIYKTLPLVEALLRGDTDIAGREAATLIETFFG